VCPWDTVDFRLLGDPHYALLEQGQTTTAQAFTLRTCDFVGTAGQHTLKFQILNMGTGDNTAFFDGIMLTVLQEAASLSVQAGPPPKLALRGKVGGSYRVEYASDLTPKSAWVTLTNVVLPASPFPILDPGAISASRRFYRALAQ
jgi:hypothetical protein